MVFKKQLAVVFMIITISLFVSCSGSVEQPKFISIFSGASSRDSTVTPKLKKFELCEQNITILEFEGRIEKIEAFAFRKDSSEQIVCAIEELDLENSKGATKHAKDNSKYKITPLTEFEIGEAFKIVGVVETNGDAVLDFSLDFNGYNSKPAKLLFSKIQLGDTKKYGFIEFTVIESGNLFGLQLVMPANSKAHEYFFPVADVKKGEFLVYHWFMPDYPDIAIDELNSDGECLDEYAVEGKRDFWGNFKRFTPKRTNALLLKTHRQGEVQDAVLFLNPTESEWGKEDIKSFAKEAGDAGLWIPSGDPENALIINITPAKMIRRKDLNNLTHSADDWLLEKASTKNKK